MHYENLFWGMACVVVIAIVGGALGAWARKIAHSLGICILLATLNCCAVIHFARVGGFADQTGILAFATFMFTLVISAASTLAMRRLLRR
jgi:Na+-translocating ferredoxin:NAD+ oxidoreductase RnfE subunit